MHRHPVIYAGRFADRVNGASLPGDFRVASEWEVTPLQLDALIEGSSVLVLLDPLSFPFEFMGEEHRDVPLFIVLPPELDFETLVAVFDAVLLQKIGIFDTVVTTDERLWERLRVEYSWGTHQGLVVDSGDPETVLGEISSALHERDPATTDFSGEIYEPHLYWGQRGDELAKRSPHRAVCSVQHDLRFNKAMHRAQAGVLENEFASIKGGGSEARPDVLEVGTGVGRWVASFDLSRTRFVGTDISQGMIDAARANFPQCNFDLLGPDLSLPYEDEGFDLAFTVTVLHHNPTEAKRKLISEMWRVTRPGGRLIFLEQFVAGKQSEAGTVFRMSIQEFVALLFDATAHQVVLEHVESIKYPGDELRRVAAISVSRLGVPKIL